MNENNNSAPVLLSIITITKDDTAGLLRTLASAQRFRYEAWVEHIVIDGSENPFEPTVGEGCVFLRQKSSGIAGAFNEGLSVARAEWVWFVNGGDVIYEDLNLAWIMTTLSITRAQVLMGALYCDGSGALRVPPPPAYQWPLTCSWPAHPATIVRRSVMVEIGGFDERLKVCMDFDLWYRLLGGMLSVDVVAIPFTRFATGGLSTNVKSRSLLQRENRVIVWRYKWRSLRALACMLWHLIRTGLTGRTW
jgi:glycosyltransferase involved in cell wall biosynthesis